MTAFPLAAVDDDDEGQEATLCYHIQKTPILVQNFSQFAVRAFVLPFYLVDMTADTEIDHRHPDDLAIRSALSHYSPADDVSHEHHSMFSRAFAKVCPVAPLGKVNDIVSLVSHQIEEVLGLKSDGFMSASEMKDAHDEFYLHGGDTEAKTTVSIDRIGKSTKIFDMRSRRI
ncbi:unnamed protein product [Umbelopsis sp. WA50703]